VNLRQALAGSGLDAREARLLLAEATGTSEASVLAYPERALGEAAEARFLDWAARRRSGEPVAYLLGRREFYGLSLEVSPAVLIPRPETELLVELALASIGPQAQARVLDLGAGSGAVALAIKRHRPRARLIAVEAEAAALQVAKRNAARLGLEIELRHGVWFQPVRGERFALIVSNPPYVAKGDPHLEQGDLRFEPRAALVAGDDGLAALRAIAEGAAAQLEPGGWILLEHGQDQHRAVQAFLAGGGLESVSSWADLAGIARVTGGKLKS